MQCYLRKFQNAGKKNKCLVQMDNVLLKLSAKLIVLNVSNFNCVYNFSWFVIMKRNVFFLIEDNRGVMHF